MANDADEIVVGGNGKVWIGALGAALPTSPTTTPVGFVDLGYLSEDGLSPRDSKTFESISVWQSLYPVRRIATERDFLVAFVLRQWNRVTVPLAFGGGDVAETGPDTNIYRYSPPDPEDLDERSMLCDWVDGTRHYRIVIPRGMVTENAESNILRTGAADLPITFSVNGQDGVDPWYLLTDDPAFAPA
jgi:hypothetical protein